MCVCDSSPDNISLKRLRKCLPVCISGEQAVNLHRFHILDMGKQLSQFSCERLSDRVHTNAKNMASRRFHTEIFPSMKYQDLRFRPNRTGYGYGVTVCMSTLFLSRSNRFSYHIWLVGCCCCFFIYFMNEKPWGSFVVFVREC